MLCKIDWKALGPNSCCENTTTACHIVFSLSRISLEARNMLMHFCFPFLFSLLGQCFVLKKSHFVRPINDSAAKHWFAYIHGFLHSTFKRKKCHDESKNTWTLKENLLDNTRNVGFFLSFAELNGGNISWQQVPAYCDIPLDFATCKKQCEIYLAR